ncbi:activating molecule in becn1-regulated autophagy protein 1 [Holotrichia oblita]|uniref:Activating molecule in becn1-regulated autophagy protein 1 n=1 Tax=Holotrichia oblita TaxID=644536 RepID=A0ACB9TE01_HOLOL|nr:activating molecule in becn1-regulated autophagy protein 1 [Holotrichia oblita]
MSNSYEHVKETNRTNIDVIKSLERRCGGYFVNSNNYLYDLKVHAEDVFVKKKYDELRCEMPGTPRSTFLMVFSPDGSKVASTHGNHNIYVTDVRSGKNIKTLVGHPRTPWCIAFHPTSNQILASGCLGGQVRIWDLSGGSETWTSEIPTVIASIAFHPDDRLLVIATYNELYFWDWSKPEPFLHVATGSIKEKVRYVAFDKLGHKLITGISNSPQTRWERVRSAVPVPRQADRSASPYRRRITPRLISNIPVISYMSENVQTPGATTSTTTATREPLTTVPERERRITACYRNLVREYELLVHRYLQIYRPPTMTDQGTDPMEIELNSITGNNLLGSLNSSNSNSQRSSETDIGTSLPVLSSTSFSSPGNDNRNVSSVTSEVLSGRSLFNTVSEMEFPQRTSLSSLYTSVNNACDDHVYNSSPSTNLTAYAETLNISSSTSTLQPSRLGDLLPNLEGNAVVPNSREIRPSSSVRNVENTLIKENKRIPTTVSNQRNERNSVLAAAVDYSSGIFPNINQRNNINSQIPEIVSEGSISRNYLRSEFVFNQVTEPHSNSNIFTDSSNLNIAAVDINRTQDNTGDSISRSVISTATSSEIHSANRVVADSNLSNSSNSSPKPLSNMNRILNAQELQHLPSNVNMAPDQISSTNVQNTRHINHEEDNANNITPLITTNESYLNLNVTRNANSNFLNSEPRPSTSGIRNRFLESCDYLCSGNDVKLFSSRCCEQSRKRDYPLLLKKNRRSVVDSSSDNSSSEEEELATKRLCTTKVASTDPSLDANDNRVSSILSRQATGDKDTALGDTPVNFNRQLEVLVTDLLVHGENSNNYLATIPNTQSTSKTTSEPAGYQACSKNSTIVSINNEQCSSTTATLANTCSRNTENTNTKTTNSTTYTHSGSQRPNRSSRFFHIERNSNYLSPAVRNRLRILNTLQNPSRLAGTFALDEVINYSERVGTEDVPESDVGFHPFDPPPEFAAINPENIGIGNMYSNIVQELESSLNDVRNIRASNRLGETSDMLSSFSERLESIMNQSNSILRNLRTSIDTLQPNSQNVTISSNSTDPDQSSTSGSQPRISFRDNNFYLREQTGNQTNDEAAVTSNTTNTLERSTSQEEIYSTASNPVASDHTYPLNSRNSESATNNMSPLMASLHLTVSHIQRQARLLRQQVESIERIDRAMLEVAQLQMMRQMFIEMQCYFRATPCHDNRNSLSRVRQMMAGTRISDSTPYDSPNDDSNNESQNDVREERLRRNGNNSNVPQNSTVVRNQTRKTYPRCIFLMQRCFRRGSAGNIFQRRCLSRDRITRRHSFRRSFAFRSSTSRTPAEFSRHVGNINQLSSDTLRSITRRLEYFLMEHGRHIGRVLEHSRSSTSTEKDEYIMMLRLNQCRSRILGQESYGNSNIRRQTNSVTTDGSTRYNARDMLTAAIENLSGHIMNGTNITQSLRTSIWNVIALSLLLSEILLLQIVDSIPPPSGMNLDPERESLSVRIDQMCSRMLQNRLSGQSQQLTRSLRLTRLARSERMLLEEINNCLRNIRRHGFVTQISNQRTGTNVENLSRTEWYRTIHSLITRYRRSSVLESSESHTNISSTNTDNAAQTETLRVVGTSGNNAPASSDDDNETYWYNNSQSSNHTSDERSDHTRPLYRTNNVNLFNLLNTEEQNSSALSRNHSWNIPTVQINDVPISQYQSQWHPRLLTSRQRVPERFLELRTYPIESIYRHRLLRPPHTNNPFEADFDESVREQLYDSDIMTPITPNHRIQVWEFSSGVVPNINNALKNVVVNECKIHNDASVDIANNGSILVTLLPSGGYLNGTNRLGSINET